MIASLQKKDFAMIDAASPVFDKDHLDRMTGGSARLAGEVLRIFTEQAEMWSRLLDPKKPRTNWADAAHTIKGAAVSIGAMRLAAACEEAETLGRGEGPVSLTEAALAVDAVRSELVVALEAVSAAAHDLSMSESFIASNASNS